MASARPSGWNWLRLLLVSATVFLLAPGAVFHAGDVEAADPQPRRILGDLNPNFSGVWVDTTNNELIVGDDNHHGILVYSRTASGTAAPLRSIKGLSTLLDYPSTVVVDLANNELWASNNDTSDRAVAFGRTANGDVAPLRVISFKDLKLKEKRTWGWSVDATHDEVAGTFQNGSAIHFFSRATGQVVRTIRGQSTGLADPHGLFIDVQNDEVLAVNEGHMFATAPHLPSLTVFARSASGDVRPLRTIQGPRTGLASPKQIYVDAKNDEIAVANGNNTITIFARQASGDVAPLRTIVGPRTGLSDPAGAFLDATNNELVVANWGGHTVTVYPRTANGDVAPLRTLISDPGGPAVGLGNPGAMYYDPVNDEFAVTNCVSHPRVAFFPRTVEGQVAPLRVIEGPATRISRSLHGVAIDPVNDEVFVPSTLEDAVLVFHRQDSGDVAPVRVIQGPSTRINRVQGLAIDVPTSEIAITNEDTPSVTIYARDADGDVAPLREIRSKELKKPVGVWIDAEHDEIIVSNEGNEGQLSQVLVFPRLADGMIDPLRIISGPNTTLDKVRQLVLDPVNDEIIVATQGNRDLDPPVFGAVLVFDRLAEGDVAPKRFLRHESTSNVKHPRSLWLDVADEELGVGDSKQNEVRVFTRTFGE